MKKLIYTFLAVSFIFTACKKEQGCTDSNATNYNADAEENDGSCMYSIVGGWDCTTMTIDSSITYSYMGVTIDSLSSSGISTTSAAEQGFFFGLDFLEGPTSGNVYVYEEPTMVTDTSEWEIVGDSLVIDQGEITFKYMVTSNTLSLKGGMSMYEEDEGMVVEINYEQTINFTRNNGFTINSTNQRRSNTTWYNKAKSITSIKLQ